MTQIGEKRILTNFRVSLTDEMVLSLQTRGDTESRRADGSSSVAGRALLGREKRVPSNYPINKYEIPYHPSSCSAPVEVILTCAETAQFIQ